ncbi:2-C-methyl-D-erythritol-2,4-cyclodiphosphate synthase [[Clostridium] ultunense Esp]|uniref:2-C-methyl-D-erythritol 2,4-cyclodiphosphate synthase n=1 Tax=[Clostridium] ultunense Esp TaxID=1288971 RepID=M1YUQ6_9FIRM|nr:2-C-methyl-D-erythritol 2,4-cyclodiphosphate synthase [Schnuerera ultunensis]CCQ94265.1 2-C-methyl-D-erythritol-2,4-cyclodiphosphate synthase [[Clostridium] ultunense Esp]SHD78615.1 2-C-methyl-D-erythritol-2,4-cyclodiphosphate synthase [[Clostridium] ultunense Esp]
MKVGIGYDVHQLVRERRLIIGGVEIPYEKGLLGHSDADVLVHAIMDSILGALGLGDIGKHFPDDDNQYKDISSLTLLERVYNIMLNSKYRIGNIDTIIIAERPRMAPYIESMKKNIAKVLNIPLSCINIKATTTEKLGFEGRGEGISAQSVCLLVPSGSKLE